MMNGIYPTAYECIHFDEWRLANAESSSPIKWHFIGTSPVTCIMQGSFQCSACIQPAASAAAKEVEKKKLWLSKRESMRCVGEKLIDSPD